MVCISFDPIIYWGERPSCQYWSHLSETGNICKSRVFNEAKYRNKSQSEQNRFGKNRNTNYSEIARIKTMRSRAALYGLLNFYKKQNFKTRMKY